MTGTPAIRNIVFDIGNVLVRWDPHAIVGRAFGDSHEDVDQVRHRVFVDSDIWRSLNRGQLTVAQAKQAYVRDGLLAASGADRLFAEIFASLDPVEGTERLMRRLADSGYRLFALTDNVHEIVAHLQERYDFWPLFEGVANSADIGVLKPDQRIYRHLLETHELCPQDSVFLDDVAANIDGAKAVGMHGFVFTTAAQAESNLRSIGVVFD